MKENEEKLSSAAAQKEKIRQRKEESGVCLYSYVFFPFTVLSVQLFDSYFSVYFNRFCTDCQKSEKGERNS